MGEIGLSSGAPGDEKDKPKKSSKKKSVSLRTKRAKVIKGIIEGKSPRKAALDAGYSESMAKNAYQKILTPAVREQLLAKMEAHGITDDLLMVRLREGLDAEKVETAKFEGRISDEKSYPDIEQRGRYWDRAAELRGYVKREDNPTASAQVTVVFMGRNGSNSQLAAEAAALVVPVERH